MPSKSVTNEIGWNLNNSYAHLPEKLFTNTNPTPVSSPELVILNHLLAKSLGLNDEALQSDDGVDVLCGNKVPKGSLPIAQAYAGHQFGYFTMLGDGRAILLGEQITPNNQIFDIQLKGSGRTPYSRRGDGRSALGPMLREYIISEAMHGLGIPTTRSLAVITTGETIFRETEQKGAILTRVADSHIRVGTFQYIAKWGTREDLKALADYTIERHYQSGEDTENKYLFLLEEVIKRQAKLIAKWQLVGFIHGVMNTDNMTISGETIDYGPCAFMDSYDLSTVFSSIDTYGRYAYGNQPAIAKWNLTRFAESLLSLIGDNQEEAIKLAEIEISKFDKLYNDYWTQGMRRKLGIFDEEHEDGELIKELLNMMQNHSADYTNTFIALTFDRLEDESMFDTQEFKNWYKVWKDRINRQGKSEESLKQLMMNSNPALIPRNHRVEEALKSAEEGNYSVMKEFIKVTSNPYEHSLEQSNYSKPPEPSSCPYRTYCGT